jgi:hypothetical protein
MTALIKSKILQSLIALILISLSVTGSDCDKVLSNNGSVPSDLIGEWQLVSQTGALQDICPLETVNFQSTMVALLTCPGSNPITRDFEISNDVLTYTQTSISYDVEITNENSELALYGRNVSRNLFYERNITAISKSELKGKATLNNSSEVKK